MFSMDLGSGESCGHVVALGGELDLVDAAAVAAALEAVAACEPRIIVDLAGLEFIGASVTAVSGPAVSEPLSAADELSARLEELLVTTCASTRSRNCPARSSAVRHAPQGTGSPGPQCHGDHLVGQHSVRNRQSLNLNPFPKRNVVSPHRHARLDYRPDHLISAWMSRVGTSIFLEVFRRAIPIPLHVRRVAPRPVRGRRARAPLRRWRPGRNRRSSRAQAAGR